jgi:hypothetical protein
MSLRFVPGILRAIHSAGAFRVRAALVGMLLATAVSAQAQTSPYNSLTLLWVAPGDDGDVGQVSGYELRYSTSPPAGVDTTGWWNGIPISQRLTLGPPLAPAGAVDSTKVTGLTPGTTYYFVLRALDEWLNISGFSNVAPGTTQSCNAPTATPGAFDATASTGEISVSWDATTDPLAVSVHLYRAQGTSGSWSLYQTLPLSTTSFLDTSVAAGALYRYRAAFMGSVCEGPSTATVTATVPAPPAPFVGAQSKIHAYPNPASGSLRVVVDVDATVSLAVRVRLFDLNGHWIATLVDGTYPPGITEVPWNRIGRGGKSVAPGYYELLGTIGLTSVRERIVLLP